MFSLKKSITHTIDRINIDAHLVILIDEKKFDKIYSFLIKMLADRGRGIHINTIINISS